MWDRVAVVFCGRRWNRGSGRDGGDVKQEGRGVRRREIGGGGAEGDGE